MTIGPDVRLVRLAGAWTLGAALVVVWPSLSPLAAAALAALVFVAGLDAVRLARMPAIAAVRMLPDRAVVGRDTEVVLTLTNAGRRDAVIDVIDELPGTLVAAEPHDVGVRVLAGGSATLRHLIRPSERGRLAIGPIVAWQRSPLALWQRRTSTGDGAELRVVPDVARYLHADPLHPRRVLVELGVRPTRERGDGMDFESLRDYVRGDDVRRIDWAATARRGRPVTRLYQHERNRTVVIALDTSRLMGSLVEGRTKLDHAVDAALALAYGAVAAAIASA